MARQIDFLVRWQVDWRPPNAPVKMEQVFRRIDERVFHDRTWMVRFWERTARTIGKFVSERFQSKPGWPPLKPIYLEWKNRAISRGYKIRVGTFGRRQVKYTEMGKLTGTLFTSATKAKKMANVFEIEDGPQYEGATFRYSIDLEKLPYAKVFDKRRPFFYLEPTEGMRVMKELQPGLIRKLHQLYRMG